MKKIYLYPGLQIEKNKTTFFEKLYKKINKDD